MIENLGDNHFKGAIEYYPANAQNPIKMTWPQFDRAMKEYK
jgi:hypothetical protein